MRVYAGCAIWHAAALILWYRSGEELEIHEACAAQVLASVAAREDRAWIKRRVGTDRDLGPFPWDRVNPNGGSVAAANAVTSRRDRAPIRSSNRSWFMHLA
jgi:hypothetical protein